MSLESVFKLSLIMNMVDNLTGPIARVQSSVDSSVSSLQNMEQTFGTMAKTGAVMAGIGAQITDAALAPVEATFETKRALGELSSLGVKDLGALEDAARSFSEQWAGTTKADFITAAYDIKSGIASLSDAGVAGYTELAGITAKATKSNIAEMTSLFATGHGIYKNFYSDLSDMEFGEMFSAGIATAVKNFKTTGSGMAQAIQTLGASATTANVPLEEQLSVLGMLQATMGGSEAGTKYKAFLRSAVRGGEELGLSFTDANNQLLSMPEILEKLKGKFGDTMDAAEKLELQKAFGDTEAVALIDLMYSKTGDLQNNILGLYSSMGEGVGAAREMASAINDTEPGRYQILQQRIQNVKETIGNGLIPTMNELLGKGEEVLTHVGTWIENNQELARIIMLVILALGAFLTVGGTTIAVLGGVGLIFTKTAGLINGVRLALKVLPGLFDTIYLKALYAGDGLKKGFGAIKSLSASAVTGIKNVALNIASMARTAAINGVTALKNMALGLVNMARQAVTTAATAMPGLIASVWSFTAALFANPITWIIIGIVALVAAIILLWRNWDSVVSWIQGAWSNFVTNIKAGFNQIRTFFSGLPQWFRESGAKIIDTLVEGIKSSAMKPVEAVKSIFQKIRNLLPFSDAKEGPLSELTLSGYRTMTTLAQGVEQGADLPAQAVEKGLDRIDTSGGREPVKKVNLKETYRETETTETTTEKDRSIIIQKLLMNVDFSKIKELPLLLKLLKEIEDYINSNGLITEVEG